MFNHYLYVVSHIHDNYDSECLAMLDSEYTDLNKLIYHLMDKYRKDFGGIWHDKQGSTYLDLIDNNEMLMGVIKIEKVSALIKNK